MMFRCDIGLCGIRSCTAELQERVGLHIRIFNGFEVTQNTANPVDCMACMLF